MPDPLFLRPTVTWSIARSPSDPLAESAHALVERQTNQIVTGLPQVFASRILADSSPVQTAQFPKPDARNPIAKFRISGRTSDPISLVISIRREHGMTRQRLECDRFSGAFRRSPKHGDGARQFTPSKAAINRAHSIRWRASRTPSFQFELVSISVH